MSTNNRIAMAALGSIILSWCGVCDANWTATQPAWSNLPQSPPAGPTWIDPPRRLPPIQQIAVQQPGETVVEPLLEVGPLLEVVPLSPAEWPLDPMFPPTADVVFEPSYEPIDGLSPQPGYPRAPPAASYMSYRLRGGPTRLRLLFGRMGNNIGQDYRNYYRCSTLRDLSLAVALAAPFANTSLDDDFDGWYQRDVRSSGTDDFASFWKTFGEGQIFIPAFAGLWLVGGMLEDRPVMGAAGTFGGRATRAYLVGGPPMLLMQFCLGGGRPGEHAVGAQWRPFQDSNAVSGHAFIGAVPFITAAKMTENPWAKSALYICSTFTAWSRVNDHDHYLTQACLGWWMAYLACRAVDETDRSGHCFEVMPLVTPQMAGVAVMYQR
ncbi:MAG: phosphatase PAP2 family protein [Thermoguttaceae bacterium]